MSASDAGSNGGSKQVGYQQIIAALVHVLPTNVACHHEGGRA